MRVLKHKHTRVAIAISIAIGDYDCICESSFVCLSALQARYRRGFLGPHMTLRSEGKVIGGEGKQCVAFFFNMGILEKNVLQNKV